MDHSNPDSFLRPLPASSPSIIEFRHHPPTTNPRVPSTRSIPNSSQRLPEAETTKKSQKADREKLRRDRLNEQFVELGNTLDHDRPKNDKATILADTVQLLKDLTAQVDKLKSEYNSLTEESRELTQEKNDLREEKASLKSDIDSRNVQYQQRVRASYPWAPMDHSMVMAPPSYPFPMPVPMSAGPMPMHPSMQPYPFFANQSPGVIHNPCSTFVPYMTPNTLVEQQSTQHVSPLAQPGGRLNVSAKQDSRNKSTGESRIERSVGSNEVTTDLELKTPGSTTDQDLSCGQRKSKKSLWKESSIIEGSSSSRCSSSCSIQDSSSGSIVGGTKADDEEGKTKI